MATAYHWQAESRGITRLKKRARTVLGKLHPQKLPTVTLPHQTGDGTHQQATRETCFSRVSIQNPVASISFFFNVQIIFRYLLRVSGSRPNVITELHTSHCWRVCSSFSDESGKEAAPPLSSSQTTVDKWSEVVVR